MALANVIGEFGIVSAPEIKFSTNGKAWASFRAVTKERVRGADGGWTDGERTFIDIVCFGNEAQNLVESANVGDTLLVIGKLQQREWTDDEGAKRVQYKVVADMLGMSLKWGPIGSKNATENAVDAVKSVMQAEEVPF